MLLLKIGLERSINGHSILFARVVISKDTSEKVIIFTEEINETFVVTYVLFREQVDKDCVLKELNVLVRLKGF